MKNIKKVTFWTIFERSRKDIGVCPVGGGYP